MENLQLSFVKTSGGYHQYRAPGHPVVYWPKAMFPATPPATIPVQGDFAPPRQRATSSSDPVKLAAQATKAEARAAKLLAQVARIKARLAEAPKPEPLAAQTAPQAAEPKAARRGKKVA
jgi:hypothetical protein